MDVRARKLKCDYKLWIVIVAILIVVLCWSLYGCAFNLYGTAMFVGFNVRAYKAQDYADLSATSEHGRFVFFGDSITEMYDNEKYFPELKTYNRGISGDTTSDMLKRIDSNIIAIQPACVFFLGGANDLMRGYTPKEAADNIELIFQKFRAERPHMPVIVQSVYPVNHNVELIGKNYSDRLKDTHTIIELNILIEALCDKYDYIFVNTFDALVKDDMLDPKFTFDGLHMNERAYAVITQLLRDEVAFLPK